MPNTKAKILCADGHGDTRELLSYVLSADGYSITTAGTMREALDLAETTDFDLLIVEKLLPDGTGVDLHRRLCATKKSIPTLFFTTAMRQNDKEVFEAIGAYLPKPAVLPAVREAILSLLPRKV